MMKRLQLLIVFLIAAIALQAQAYRGYYDGITDQTGDDLKAALHNIIKNDNHTSYNGLWSAYYQTDKRGTNKVWDIYSDNPNGALPYEYTLGDSQCGNYNGEGSCYNREHLWAQSWAKGTKHETDLHHVYPTDGYVNARRGNYAFGEVGNASWTSLNGGKLGTCTTTGYSSTVFEPIDEYKGDIARALMYVSVRYYTEDDGWGSSGMTSGSDILPWAVTMLLRWHAEDPVSAKEIARNEAVYGIQGNRNPFVDHPEYAARIWAPNTSYNIVASVYPSNSGTVTGAGSYSAGQSCTLTATPNVGYTFLNWTKNNVIVSNNATYTFTVAENATYKANFGTTTNYQIAVTASDGGSAYIGDSPTPTSVTKSITFSDLYSVNTDLNGITVPIDSNVGVTFNKNTGGTNPQYYTNGSAVRCYAGNNFIIDAGDYTITSITLTYGDGDGSNAITTNVNTFNSNKWTGSASSVTFTIGGSSGNRRIASISVTYSSGSPATQANFAVGSTATVTASPTSGYSFIDWTKNNVHVSSDIAYTFTVTEAANLKANFMNNIVSSDQEITSLTINGEIRVWSGKKLTVTGAITQPEGSNFITLNNTGQLVNSTPGITGKVKKNITVWNENSKTGWQAVATPVNNVTFANVTNLTSSTYNVYRLNETNLTWENSQNHDNSFSSFDNGRGYLYRKGNDYNLIFNGTFNVGSVIYPLTYTSSTTKGFHLIGNPYPHNIYKGDGAAIPNTYLEEGFYTLTSNGAWLAGTDKTTAIIPCQAILVQAKNTVVEGDELTITHTTANGAKSDIDDNIMFVVSNRDYHDVAYAVFKEGHGLNKIDHRNEDIQKLSIEHNGEDFAIAEIGEGASAFDLKFHAATTGMYTMKVNVDGDFSCLHLIDRITGEDVDLLMDNNYSFVGSPTDYDNRFIVRFTCNSAADIDNDVFAYQSGKEIIIEGYGELQIFDVMGRIVTTQYLNGSGTWRAESVPTGVYILRLIGEDVKTQKIVVK